ncbi:MAG: sigE 2 [Pseudonocardiales bacterium]|nr:sigE 2 [Pseudonocardiales bacterium]
MAESGVRIGAVDDALTRLAREESGRVLALLARQFRDLDLADDAVQDALAEAAEHWPRTGAPHNPAAWLMTVARRKAIDRLRREQSRTRRLLAAAPELTASPGADDPKERWVRDDGEVGDEQLRLILLCCHPALDRDAQVALTLRLVGGLTTSEIAAAFLVPEATLAQRIVRAKRKIRDAGIPLSIPAELDARIEALLGVLYLIFNEGYLSRGAGEQAVRVDLLDEALRLAVHVRTLLPAHSEVDALVALQLYHRARLASRLGADAGELILLADQDRSRWDRVMIGQANALMSAATQRMEPGPYQLQAMIAAYHCNARTAADTDWSTIAELYRHLLSRTASPVVALNRAVAVAMADGPRVGLALLDAIDGLDDYHLLHASRAELLLRDGDAAGAHTAFERARRLATNPAEQRHLDRRLAQTQTPG